MRICNLASGSKGNMTYVETEDSKILVDCGLGMREIESRLAKLDITPDAIDAILITHSHTDHISGLNSFVNKNKVLVFVHYESLNEVRTKSKLPKDTFTIFYDTDFFIKSTKVYPLALSHDTASCKGFTISCKAGKVSIITDTGEIKTSELNVIQGSNVVYLEANYNETMLMNNQNYPISLKKRILSKKGHLSNRQCAEYMFKLYQLGCVQFVLSHISENNNTPKLAYLDITDYMFSKKLYEGKDYCIDLTWQSQTGTIYLIDGNNKKKILKSITI